MNRLNYLWLLALSANFAHALDETTAAAETPPADENVAQLETVVVVSTTQLPGVGIDIDKIPGNTQTLSASDLSAEGTPSIITSIYDKLSSVNINDNLVNPFQPDILYRGFEASPVRGTPQGLAVYQNGVRINEAFGDVVNWDLFPDLAINSVSVVSANPVYGLNALGGAVIINMKNGFNYKGSSAEVYGGSFGRASTAIQFGDQKDNWGIYMAARYLNESGWRQFSPSTLQQLYTDVAYHGEKLKMDVSFTGADNDLWGEGITPVQELAVNRSLVFTTPQYNLNKLSFVNFNAQYDFSETLSYQANLYYRGFHQNVMNGDTSEYEECDDGFGNIIVCQQNNAGDDVPVLGMNGLPLPYPGSPIGQNDSELIPSYGRGGALQLTSKAPLWDHENQFSMGGSFDYALTNFQSLIEVGSINKALQVSSTGDYVNQIENNDGLIPSPVRVQATNTYGGVYLTDTYNVTSDLAGTASGRYNYAMINLADQQGPNLNGHNIYQRFNPAIGFTYKVIPKMTVYAGYAEGNRAPTPSELECADPEMPCLLPSSLSSDPYLAQVVSHTYEAGLRGKTPLPILNSANGGLTWNAGLYLTNLDNDIYGIASTLNRGYFANIGQTRRAGGELGLSYDTENTTTFLNYSRVDATFQSPMEMYSPDNPDAVDDKIYVQPGNVIPGIPANQLKAGIEYHNDKWKIGANLVYFSSIYYRGDEANLLAPLAGFSTINLHSSYQVSSSFEVFGMINNLFNAKYASFGALGNPSGIDAPGVPDVGYNPRFQGPGTPISAYAGVRAKV